MSNILKTDNPQAVLNPPERDIPQITAILETPEQDIKIIMNADVLYFHVHKAIQFMMVGGVNDSQENKRLAQLIKAAVKGVLLMYGHKIIDSMWQGTNEPAPRPTKQDDVLQWYTDFFTKVAIVQASQSSLHLLTGDKHKNVDTTYKITGLRTESISESI